MENKESTKLVEELIQMTKRVKEIGKMTGKFIEISFSRNTDLDEDVNTLNVHAPEGVSKKAFAYNDYENFKAWMEDGDFRRITPAEYDIFK